MTVKALKKQLMAAIAMVVVSAIALSSSTYAWFAANNAVSATGMKVQAVTEDGIEIAPIAVSAEVNSIADSAYATSATAENSTLVSLYPTSTSNLTNWFHASAANAAASTAALTTYRELTLDADTGVESTTSKQYFLLNTFVIRTVKGSTNTKDVRVAGIEVTAGQDISALDQSLRIAVTDGTTTLYYKPSLADDGTLGSVSGLTLTSGVVTAVTKDTTTALLAPATEGAPDNFLSAVSTAGTKFKVYVYYEGEDTVHYSNNVQNALQQLNVTLKFNAVDHTS